MPICSIYNTLGEKLRSFNTVEFGWTVTIGRSSQCDVSLKGLCDNNVSREHIFLRRTGMTWVLESRGHSGVYYNAQKIQSMVIEDGMIFRFSQLFLCIGEKTGPSPFDLTWEAETENNQHHAIIWPGINSIGASRDNYITVRTEDIARVHGRITYKDERLFYEDLHTTRGSQINDIEVYDNTVELYEGDDLVLGETHINIIHPVRAQRQAVINNTVAAVNQQQEQKKKKKTKAGLITITILAVILFLLIFLLMLITVHSILFV